MDIFTKAINLGFGAFYFTKEKTEKLIEEMVAQGEINREQAQEAFEALMKRGGEQANYIKELVEAEFKKLRSKSVNLSKEEYDELLQRLDKLEKQVANSTPQDN